MSAVAKFMAEQIRFNGAIMTALKAIEESQARMAAIIASARPGELSGLEQWNVLTDEVPQVAFDPERYTGGCNSCIPRVPASNQSEGYRCNHCRTQWVPLMGGDAKWTWVH